MWRFYTPTLWSMLFGSVLNTIGLVQLTLIYLGNMNFSLSMIYLLLGAFFTLLITRFISMMVVSNWLEKNKVETKFLRVKSDFFDFKALYKNRFKYEIITEKKTFILCLNRGKVISRV